jgi:hypothetical protein
MDERRNKEKKDHTVTTTPAPVVILRQRPVEAASEPARSMNGGRGSQFPCGAAASVYSEHQVQQPE